MPQYTEHVSRFYSLALGRSKNFNARTDGLIAAADTTPDVSLYSLLYNSSTNTISYFDNGVEGQIVKVINLPDEKLLFSGLQMKVASSAGLYQGDNITFINHNSAWYETNRSNASNPRVAVAAEADATPSVKNASLLIVPNSAALTITNFDDGYAGQVLTVIADSASITISNGTIINGRSDQAYVLTASDSTAYVFSGSKWFNIGIASFFQTTT